MTQAEFANLSFSFSAKSSEDGEELNLHFTQQDF